MQYDALTLKPMARNGVKGSGVPAPVDMANQSELLWPSSENRENIHWMEPKLAGAGKGIDGLSRAGRNGPL